MDLFENAEAPPTAPRPDDAPATEPPPDGGHYIVYARKWRPQTFDEVVGQDHAATALKNAISSGRIAHAYLFTGPRGVGKTSMARILAKALNCQSGDGPAPNPCGRCNQCRSIAMGNNLDVIEIDGASNNKVDEIRDLREAVGYTPFAGRYKVYIIDEVHMLSIGAFNALLKTLEEPPSRVVFVLATTELQKIPATIISRCQPFEFQPISPADIIIRLNYIIDQEQAEVAEGERQAILETIAHYAEGGMRDAQVALDQAITLSEGALNLASVQDLLGLVDHTVCAQLIEGVRDAKVEELLQLVGQLTGKGCDLARIVKQAMQFTRDLLILKNTSPRSQLVQCPADQRQVMENLAERIGTPFLLNLSHRLVELEAQMKGAAPQRFLLELALIQLASVSKDMEVGGLIEEVQGLKTLLAAGQSAPPGGAPAQTTQMRDPGIAAPAAAPPPVQKVDIENPGGVWAALIAAVEHTRPIVAQHLSSLRVVALDERALEAGIPDVSGARAKRDQVLEKPENARLIIRLLREITGRDLRIKYRIVEAPEPAAAPAPALADAAPPARKNPPAPYDERQEARDQNHVRTHIDPEERVRTLLETYPEFKAQLRQALAALGGGRVVGIDGVPLPHAIAEV